MFASRDCNDPFPIPILEHFGHYFVYFQMVLCDFREVGDYVRFETSFQQVGPLWQPGL